MLRLFIALDLPQDIKDRIRPLLSGVPGAKWSRPENLHLTLRFLGNTDGRTFVDLRDRLSQIDAPEFDLELKGVGTFSEGQKVTQLWAGVAKSEGLIRLQTKIERLVQMEGFPAETRKFHPHVTLARVRYTPIDDIQHYLAAGFSYRTPPFRVMRFILYSSFLSDNGAIYREEASYPLRQGTYPPKAFQVW